MVFSLQEHKHRVFDEDQGKLLKRIISEKIFQKRMVS